MSVQNVDINFNWKWYLRELNAIPKKDVNVFSCFSCGGGSSMGYKRNGFNVIGCCEIDPKIANVYNKNLHPKYLFIKDIRDFNKIPDNELPKELFNLDILDGSPPCSTFSFSGLREKAWGKEKKFREGQANQTLDDLCFEYLKTAEKLQPKIIILENVKGIIMGNAKKYSNEIIKRIHQLGYEVQIFLLNSQFMNVPQIRERVFFIANNQNYPKLKLRFNEIPIIYREIRNNENYKINKYSEGYKIATKTKKYFADITEKQMNKRNMFNHIVVDFNSPLPTIQATVNLYDPKNLNVITEQTVINGSTFPQDYNFCDQSINFICGMSVPPNMMANIAKQVYLQWLKK